MDIQRSTSATRRWARRAPLAIGAALVLALSLAAVALLNRSPGIDGESIWYATVEHGEMVREVAASGHLVAPRIRAVTNRNAGVVEEVRLLPGDRVTADDVVLVMSSPDLEEDLASARWDLAEAEAQEAVEQVEVENRHLDIIAQLASAQAEHTSARLELQAKEELSDAQVFSELEIERSRLQVQQLASRLEAEQARLERAPEHRAAREEAQRARLARHREQVDHLESLIDHLDVRAGTNGVVQEINIEDGERLTAGELVARVVDPEHLIARLGVPEREAAAILPGLGVTLEAGRERFTGEVVRIDPTARDRTIDVDVALAGGDLPALRPDQSVRGRIELERLEDVVYLPRPATARREGEHLELFVLDDNGRHAHRRRVEIGRLSASEAEIHAGLAPGERVILADMAEYEAVDSVRIR